ncbi:MAG: glycosyltransferase [Vicinamibacterales bacterium]
MPLPPKSLADYSAVAGREAVAALRVKAAPFKGARVLHLNSTAYGGGVAELLQTLVPLQRDLGMDAEWRVLQGTESFFHVTKSMHNALQGAEVDWSDQMEATYREVNETNAQAFDGAYDFVVVHDPQPAPLLSILNARGAHKGRWIWRCHIDLTEVYQPVWSFLQPYVSAYDAAIFTMADFVPEGLTGPRITIIAPTIDPLSLKNVGLDQDVRDAVLHAYGVDPSRPILLQVSRFDPWKDPLGVIDAYRMVKQEIADVVLILAGSMASDDPEGMEYWSRTAEHAQGDPDVVMLTNVEGVGNLEINAFQRSADVVIQKSLREGFGLTVTEAMWKAKPVIGGACGGIRAQIREGQNGFLVSNAEQCAQRALELIRDREHAAEIGRAARVSVRERFLSTHSLDAFLSLLETLS